MPARKSPSNDRKEENNRPRRRQSIRELEEPRTGPSYGDEPDAREKLSQKLHELAQREPYRLFWLNEILVMFNLDRRKAVRFRQMSERDPMTDPWIGQKTRPEKFAEWLWGKRLQLERDPKCRDI